jgi:acyl-coenzyme A synthetase/AMP-(fatty) acid ligase
LGSELLVLVLRLEQNQELSQGLKDEIGKCNRTLPDYKRVGGYILWDKDFPRTASMKTKRPVLAEQMAQKLERAAAVIRL